MREYTRNLYKKTPVYHCDYEIDFPPDKSQYPVRRVHRADTKRGEPYQRAARKSILNLPMKSGILSRNRGAGSRFQPPTGFKPPRRRGLLFFLFHLRHVPLRNVALHDVGRDAGRLGLANQPFESELPLRKGFFGIADSKHLL